MGAFKKNLEGPTKKENPKAILNKGKTIVEGQKKSKPFQIPCRSQHANSYDESQQSFVEILKEKTQGTFLQCISF